MIRFCQLLEPTVGGINLEDIKAPDCFYIEETLRKTMKIPVFHDDQHGTAIISGAGLLNAVEIVGKNLDAIRVVFSGAGAAAIATAEHYVRLGVRREHITLCDREGVIYRGRPGEVDRYKARFAVETSARTVGDALRGADVFVGLSVAGAVTKEMIAAMGPRPIVFALANPVPEILPDEVRLVRDDAIIATGRSDYPNQVNNESSSNTARTSARLIQTENCRPRCSRRTRATHILPRQSASSERRVVASSTRARRSSFPTSTFTMPLACHTAAPSSRAHRPTDRRPPLHQERLSEPVPPDLAEGRGPELG